MYSRRTRSSMVNWVAVATLVAMVVTIGSLFGVSCYLCNRNTDHTMNLMIEHQQREDALYGLSNK